MAQHSGTKTAEMKTQEYICGVDEKLEILRGVKVTIIGAGIVFDRNWKEMFSIDE